VVVLAGELVLLGADPLQAEGRLTAEDDNEPVPAVKELSPRSLMKLSIYYIPTQHIMTQLIKTISCINLYAVITVVLNF